MRNTAIRGFISLVLFGLMLGSVTVAHAQTSAVVKVYWTDRDTATLYATDLSSGVSQPLAQGIFRLQDVDLDTNTGTLYFAEWGPPGTGPGSIKQVNRDGTGLATVFSAGPAVHQLALDQTNQLIYFTRAVSTGGHEISVVDYSGGNYTVLFAGGFSGPGWFPSGLALDSANNFMYWGDIGVLLFPPNGSVNRMTTSGAAPTQLTPHVNGRGRGFALEPVSQTIFLTSHDPLSPGSGGGLFSYDIASNVETQLISDPTTGYWDVEIDPIGQRIWWTDYGRGEIRSAKFDGTDVRVELSGLTSPYGLALELVAEAEGRMTGGGSVIDATVGRVTHGFQLHCDETNLPNNLQVNWGKGNNFHLETLTSAFCFDDPSIDPGQPAAAFDTYEGTGDGRCNGQPASIDFKLTDAGEPGVNDEAEFSISGACTLAVSGKLDRGNHQAHPIE